MSTRTSSGNCFLGDQSSAAFLCALLASPFEDAGLQVLEIAPPRVRTELLNSQEAEAAMPLDSFVEKTMVALATNADAIIVERAKPMHNGAGPSEHAYLDQFNTH